MADLCAGSGPTAVAALNTSRSFICFETVPAYYASATERIRLARAALEACLLYTSFDEEGLKVLLVEKTHVAPGHTGAISKLPGDLIYEEEDVYKRQAFGGAGAEPCGGDQENVLYPEHAHGSLYSRLPRKLQTKRRLHR